MPYLLRRLKQSVILILKGQPDRTKSTICCTKVLRKSAYLTKGIVAAKILWLFVDQGFVAGYG